MLVCRLLSWRVFVSFSFSLFLWAPFLVVGSTVVLMDSLVLYPTAKAYNEVLGPLIHRDIGDKQASGQLGQVHGHESLASSLPRSTDPYTTRTVEQLGTVFSAMSLEKDTFMLDILELKCRAQSFMFPGLY